MDQKLLALGLAQKPVICCLDRKSFLFRGGTTGDYISKPLSCLKQETREVVQACPQKRGETMEWIRPDFEEISLGCEINCYATAEL
jgi:coenzyme PQQ precursor peptide PqqA